MGRGMVLVAAGLGAVALAGHFVEKTYSSEVPNAIRHDNGNTISGAG